MKQELLKKIIPIIEEFVDKILSSFGDLEHIRKQAIQEQIKYQDLNEEKEKELKLIKEQRSTWQKEYDKKITELEDAKEDYIAKSKSYTDLINELKINKKEITRNLEDSEIELIRAKEVRIQSDDLKNQAQKIKNDYLLKLESLNIDFKKIKDQYINISFEKEKLKFREDKLYKLEVAI